MANSTSNTGGDNKDATVSPLSTTYSTTSTVAPPSELSDPGSCPGTPLPVYEETIPSNAGDLIVDEKRMQCEDTIRYSGPDSASEARPPFPPRDLHPALRDGRAVSSGLARKPVQSSPPGSDLEYSDLPEVVTPTCYSQLPETVRKSRSLDAPEPVIPARVMSGGSGPSSSLGVPTVTPIRLLGDQPDTVDCPFCFRRVETKVKRPPSPLTHKYALAMFFTTAAGVVAPYAGHWGSHVDHYCTNCNRKVAHKEYNKDEVEVLGTPAHLREVSKYPAAPNQPSYTP